MSGFPVDRRGLKVLCSLCAVLLVPAALAFLVNIELGLRVFWPTFRFVEPWMPTALFAWGAQCSVDLSAVSTFIPVLMLAFPLIQAIRILRRDPLEASFIRNLTSDPYPVHFAFFLVMLGLVGTLHGMWIGLRTSGIDTVGAQAGSPEAIQETLDRLLGGTATAIISSLVGIIAAFIAARPVPWAFRRLIRIQAEEQRQTLSQTLEHLNRDLTALGTSARAWKSEMERISPAALPEKLDAIIAKLNDVNTSIAKQDAHWQGIQAGQQTLIDRVSCLTPITEQVTAQTLALKELVHAVTSMREAQDRAETRWTGLLQPIADQQRQVADQLRLLSELLARTADEQRIDRASLKRALAEFAK